VISSGTVSGPTVVEAFGGVTPEKPSWSVGLIHAKANCHSAVWHIRTICVQFLKDRPAGSWLIVSLLPFFTWGDRKRNTFAQAARGAS
jgi:hypothetical protein